MALPMMSAVWSADVPPLERLPPYHGYPNAVSSIQRQRQGTATYMSTLVCVCPEIDQRHRISYLENDLHLEILNMTTNGILVRTSITSEDIHQHPRLLQSLSTIVSLHDRDHVRGPLTAVLQPSELE